MTSDVLLGAGIALVGAVLPQIVSVALKYLDTSKEKNEFYRGKCEQLSKFVTDSTLWFNKLSLCHTYEDVKKCHPPIEAYSAVSLASLYFPDLADPTAIYHNHLLHYYNWLLSLQSPTIQYPMSIMEMAEGNKNYNAIHGSITQAKNDLQIRLSQQVKKYL